MRSRLQVPAQKQLMLSNLLLLGGVFSPEFVHRAEIRFLIAFLKNCLLYETSSVKLVNMTYWHVPCYGLGLIKCMMGDSHKECIIKLCSPNWRYSKSFWLLYSKCNLHYIFCVSVHIPLSLFAEQERCWWNMRPWNWRNRKKPTAASWRNGKANWNLASRQVASYRAFFGSRKCQFIANSFSVFTNYLWISLLCVFWTWFFSLQLS